MSFVEEGEAAQVLFPLQMLVANWIQACRFQRNAGGSGGSARTTATSISAICKAEKSLDARFRRRAATSIALLYTRAELGKLLQNLGQNSSAPTSASQRSHSKYLRAHGPKRHAMQTLTSIRLQHCCRGPPLKRRRHAPQPPTRTHRQTQKPQQIH